MFNRKTFVTAPRNVASARDFNRIDADGVDANHIESSYADFEGAAARALVQMDEKRGFGDEEEHNLVLNLIALFSVRNPRMRENMRQFHEQVAKQIMSLTVATKERYESSMVRAVRSGRRSKSRWPTASPSGMATARFTRATTASGTRSRREISAGAPTCCGNFLIQMNVDGDTHERL
ncbi:MAG TPA: DUF4238 domain-containing protein [Rhodocyclaceae bacterium]|nr:DUF4238 domain-containing protein [Rhodocyclaceae bacterium]